MLPPGGLGTSTVAYGLNDTGVAVGSYRPSSYEQAAVWHPADGSTRAGVALPLLAGDNYSLASEVNTAGLIVGVSGVNADTAAAVTWTGGGSTYSVRDLVSLGGSFTHDQATSVSERDANDVAWVVGRSWYVSGGNTFEHPTVWCVDAAGNTLSTIDLEPTHTTAASAAAVRVVGSAIYVAGEYRLPDNSNRARVWTLDLAGNVVARTDPGTLGGASSWSAGINGQGHVVGQSKTTGGAFRAFLYRDGQMLDLGTLTNGFSQGAALNDDDTVVGTCAVYGQNGTLQTWKAFIWEGGSMQDLRGNLSSKDRSKWNALFFAFDVNATGQVVGNGSIGKGNSTKGRGLVMTPPGLQAPGVGPGSAATLAAAQTTPLVAEALRRWRSTGEDTSMLRGLDVRITDLGGATLGLASGNTIWLDDNAAGWGWFVDKTPWEDSEFNRPGNQGEKRRIDLLSVLMHEVGHLLGRDHDDGGVMTETLASCKRLTPGGAIVQSPGDLFAVLDFTKRRAQVSYVPQPTSAPRIAVEPPGRYAHGND